MANGTGFAAVGFGLAASFSWGTSDFSGGLAAKRAPIFGVMAISYTVGLALLIGLALARAEAIPSAADLAWSAAAGIAGATGLTAQYRALAVGRMGIAAPVAAVLGAAIPVGFSAAAEGLPGTAQLGGFALAILSVWLISRPSGVDGRQDGIGLAVLAGLGFGLFFILLDQVSEDAVFWPLVSARGCSLVIMLALAISSRRAWRPSMHALPVVLLAGVLDVGGNTFFLLASQAGRLDVASVLSSLYPAVTVLLARFLLDEHIARVQAAGVIAALVAIPLIAG